MTGTPIDIHPDLANLDGPTVPLAWLMHALAESEKNAVEELDRTNDLRPSFGERLIDTYVDGMRDAAQFIHDRIAWLLDPAAYEAEEARRCTEAARGMGFDDPEADQGGTW